MREESEMYLAEIVFKEEVRKKAKEAGVILNEKILEEITIEICDHLDDVMDYYYDNNTEKFARGLGVDVCKKDEDVDQDEVEFETDRVSVYSLETGEYLGS